MVGIAFWCFSSLVVLSEVGKGLKRRSGAGLGVMMLPVESYVYMQKKLLERGDPLSLCLADYNILQNT